MSELWKLTDSTGVYVKPQPRHNRTRYIGQWCGLALFIDLDESTYVDALAIHELEKHLGRDIDGVFTRPGIGAKP